jgi:hypothetical protein
MTLSTRFVGYPRGNAGHQTIVINSVEELFEVEINDDVVTLGNVVLRSGHRPRLLAAASH